MRRLLFIVTIIVLPFFTGFPAYAQLLTGYDVKPQNPEPQQPETVKPEQAVQLTEEIVEDVELFIATPPLPDEGDAWDEAPKTLDIASSQPPQLLTGVDERQPYKPLMTGFQSEHGSTSAETQVNDRAPVDIQADQLSRDEGSNTVSASGDVMIVQAGRILRADDVEYDLTTDTARASGQVVLNEENGDVHLADTADYNNRLRDGHVTNLRTVLADGSRLTAEQGERQGGVKTIMHDASYTPCKICEDEPDKAPLWGLVASEVTHDQEKRRVTYKHARFETFETTCLVSILWFFLPSPCL